MAPCGSVTTPVTLPVSPCAKVVAGIASMTAPTNIRRATKIEAFFIWRDPPVIKREPQSYKRIACSFASLTLRKATFELRVKVGEKQGIRLWRAKALEPENLRGEYIPID